MLILALALASAPISAVRIDADDRPTAVVDSRDLDLTKPSDVRRLEQRVRIASTRLCAIAGRTLADFTWRNGCLADAARSAEPRVETLVASARQAGATRLTVY